MSKLFRSPKALTILILVLGTFVLSIAGGALGNEFGGGFLGSPIAHIQLPAEPVLEDELFPGFELTNTMVTTWITVLAIIVLAFLATRRMTEVPTGLQNVFEALIEFFSDLATSIAGPERGRRFLPLALTIFLFIVTANWLGILPGFGTIGRIETPEDVIHHAEEKAGAEIDLTGVHLQIFDGKGFLALALPGSMDETITAAEFEEHGVGDGKQAGLLVPFLRSANTDVNTTLAIAIVAMFAVHFWAFATLGFGHIGKFLDFKGGPIALFVGILEAVSEVARLISFTFRLFGNIFAGEVLLIAMAFLLPLIGIIPFLGLELFVGLIQAFIFSLLTLVFASLATATHETNH
ncbi:MAG: F0F1 ATP synthase subunit A [Chloroflexi bacterium]|nr:F0F1 ATP synthase subunit A [Chloroflexota bacterium]